MDTILRKYIFSGKHFYRQLLTLAIPITLQNLIASSLGMIDTVMVGALGDSEIAAVGSANQYGLLVFLMYASIYSGAGIFISQFWGKKDADNIKKVAAIGLVLGTIAAIAFSIAGYIFARQIIQLFSPDPAVISDGAKFLKILSLSFPFASVSFGFSLYLRSIGKSVLPMVVSGCALGLNTLLNFMLIFGRLGFPAMGVRGAGIATLIARIAEMLVFIIIIYSSFDIFAIKVKIYRHIGYDLFIRVCKGIAPVLMNEIFWGTGFMVYSAVYGRISTESLAAVQVTSTTVNLFQVAAFGMASAAAVMIGHKVGSGEEQKAREYAWRFVIIAVFTGIILGGLMAISAKGIVSMFNVSDIVRNSAVMILYMTAIIFIIRLVNIITIVGLLRGGGDASFAFITEALTMWLVGVPMSLLGAFVLRLEVQWVVLMIMAEEITKLVIILIRLSSNKWIKNVIKDV